MLVALVLLLAADNPLGEPSMTALWAAPMIGLLGITVMTLTVVYGVSHMPIHRSAIILLFEIIVGAVSSQLLTNEVISLHEWLGGALVMLAAFLSAKKQAG